MYLVLKLCLEFSSLRSFDNVPYTPPPPHILFTLRLNCLELFLSSELIQVYKISWSGSCIPPTPTHILTATVWKLCQHSRPVVSPHVHSELTRIQSSTGCYMIKQGVTAYNHTIYSTNSSYFSGPSVCAALWCCTGKKLPLLRVFFSHSHPGKNILGDSPWAQVFWIFPQHILPYPWCWRMINCNSTYSRITGQSIVWVSYCHNSISINGPNIESVTNAHQNEGSYARDSWGQNWIAEEGWMDD
jgi:hypothetical protein